MAVGEKPSHDQELTKFVHFVSTRVVRGGGEEVLRRSRGGRAVDEKTDNVIALAVSVGEIEAITIV